MLWSSYRLSRQTGSMSTAMQDVLLRYPPRELSPLERELIDRWLAGSADIPGAYVSGRKTDDLEIRCACWRIGTPGCQRAKLLWYS
jgi:hypothetical protein